MSWKYSLKVTDERRPIKLYVTDELNHTVEIGEGYKDVTRAVLAAREHAGMDVAIPLALA